MEKYTLEELQDLKVAELKSILEANNITFSKNIRKDKLIELILSQVEKNTETPAAKTITQANMNIFKSIEDTPVQRPRASRRFRPKAKFYRDGGSITINRNDIVQKASTPEEMAFSDIKASRDKNLKKTLTAKVTGVSPRKGENGKLTYLATCQYGNFKIIIPAEEFLLEYNPEEEPARIKQWLNKRMGSEIDFKITYISDEEPIALASRTYAMREARAAWFQKRTGSNKDYEISRGSVVTARVVTTVSKGAYVEVFGAECFIPNSELSYSYILHSSDSVKVGDKISVVITKVERDSKNRKVDFDASVKRTSPDPKPGLFNQFKIGEIRQGTVTGYTDVSPVERKFYVAADNYDLLCTMRSGLPMYPEKGDTVQVEIINKYENELRITGRIVHIC